MLNDQVPDRPAGERLLTLVCYVLFILALVNGLTFLIGGVLAHVRRGGALGTIWADHYRNMILVFWTAIIVAVLTMGMVLSGLLAAASLALWPGWTSAWLFGLPLLGAGGALAMAMWLIFAIWYLYRILRGFFRALDDKPY
jgi:uncharacterized membrane protein